MASLAGGDGQTQDLTGLDGTIAGQFIFIEDGLDDLTDIRIFIDDDRRQLPNGLTRFDTNGNVFL